MLPKNFTSKLWQRMVRQSNLEHLISFGIEKSFDSPLFVYSLRHQLVRPLPEVPVRLQALHVARSGFDHALSVHVKR